MIRSIPALERYIGCILGGAIGDALGYPIEFDTLAAITYRYGEAGVTGLQPDGSGRALISDDTQMTLFTVDGLLNTYSQSPDTADWPLFPPKGFLASYLTWLYTQTEFEDVLGMAAGYTQKNPYGYGMTDPALFHSRAPGRTCISALMAICKGEEVHNNSKGCGGVMRVAPVGLFFPDDPVLAYRVGAQAANITHKHPTSDEASGALASIISLMVSGNSIRRALGQTLLILDGLEYPNRETADKLNQALTLAEQKAPVRESIAALGEGWVAEEALAIAVYCALTAEDFRQGLIHAVNHDGDSDSTGAICGNLLGALFGVRAIPADWLEKLELREFMERLTGVLYRVAKERLTNR